MIVFNLLVVFVWAIFMYKLTSALVHFLKDQDADIQAVSNSTQTSSQMPNQTPDQITAQTTDQTPTNLILDQPVD
jgi:hypothetical protein